MERFTSRKFLLALGTAIFGVLGVLTGQLTFDQASHVIEVAVGLFIAAEGLGDAAERHAAGSAAPADTAWTAKPGEPTDPSKATASGISGFDSAGVSGI